jgi:large subunit ribosomal protein L30
MADLKITMTRSLIGQKPTIKKTAVALGLKRPNKYVIRKDTPYIRGMIQKLDFMVKVEEL